MIAVQNIDSIAAIEELYSALGEGDSKMTLATHLKGDVIGARAALLQFIITWMRRSSNRELITHIQNRTDADVMLADLCDSEHGLIALALTSRVIGVTNIDFSEKARIAARQYYFNTHQEPRHKGNRLFLIVFDHLVSAQPQTPYLGLTPAPRRERKERFISYLRGYLRSCLERAKAPSLSEYESEQLYEIIYELWTNSEEWGSVLADRTPLKRSVRGIMIQVHVPKETNGFAFHNPKRDPVHVGRYLSQFSSLKPGKGALLEISVFDSGIGLARQKRESDTRPIVDRKDEYHAVIECFGKHASSSADPSRGLGLFSVMQLLTRTRGYLRFRGGRLSLYRDFTFHPHPYANRPYAPPIYESGAGRKQIEFLLDWNNDSPDLAEHYDAAGALMTAWIPLQRLQPQMDLPLR